MSNPNKAPDPSTRNSCVTITVAKDSMSAIMILRKPADEEPPITKDVILSEISAAEIIFGVDETAIDKAIENEEFNQAITIANGIPPRRGESSSFEYHFSTSGDHHPEEDENGNLDYKNINFIQNIAKSGLLVSKTPATLGETGTTVFGKELLGPPGVDLPLKSGNNTEISEDGLKLIASVDGAILYTHGTVAVNDVTVIKGDVDFGVGNIVSRASVRVMGGVRAGFSIKTSGDIEVNENVEDCSLIAGGNIFVKGGIIGNEEGEIKADGNITAKFVGNHSLSAGCEITIGEEVVNSQLKADDSITVQSRVGRIVGGSCSAGKKIVVAVAGSETETATALEITLDPDLMRTHAETVDDIQRLKDDGKRIKEALIELYRLQLDGKLSFQKKQILGKLEKANEAFPVRLSQLDSRRKELEAQLADIKDVHIDVLSRVYPGVTARFGVVHKTVFEERDQCRFELVDNEVIFTSISDSV